ncbi:hypothetical protein NC651_027275 [Populus alba x Populus x berolinensis]|uniref:Uncharacterized protein n=1 Tax=Populus alba x Populus x berolinensis TaxID=444605 RepID=A0AAD6M743_9ROSI|nr:hypothetical protein NC651_027275 [Populus alba x Populus x berolinensis]KAJ6979951.1 hypothetical protein NC653_027932 [Populus alba x Populus x berolinensis]
MESASTRIHRCSHRAMASARISRNHHCSHRAMEST